MRRSSLLMTDRQRSAVMGLSTAGAAARSYAPYGYVSSSAGPFTAFAGERHDRHTGCYHLGRGARLYSPTLMRFLSPDRLSPFGRGGINVYAYCAGDPVNHVDPTGRMRQMVVDALTVNARSLTTAAYAGIVGALLVNKNAPRRALQQALIEGPLVVIGLHMQYSDNPTVQGVGLALMGAGVSSAIVKAGWGIFQGLRENGLVGTGKVVTNNVKRIFKETNHDNGRGIELQNQTVSGNIEPSASVSIEHVSTSRTDSPISSTTDFRNAGLVLKKSHDEFITRL